MVSCATTGALLSRSRTCLGILSSSLSFIRFSGAVLPGQNVMKGTRRIRGCKPFSLKLRRSSFGEIMRLTCQLWVSAHQISGLLDRAAKHLHTSANLRVFFCLTITNNGKKCVWCTALYHKAGFHDNRRRAQGGKRRRAHQRGATCSAN